jgi:endonuclease/exonuclease/phosphatase family metal-dependent hydrolase
MSLNVLGHETMPQSAGTYAALIEAQNVDIVGVQEGVQDWLLDTEMPTDYSRAEALGTALGEECWERDYQVFINTCRGNAFSSFQRFDLTDGPNATRTGEEAVVTKDGKSYAFINIHWDHQSADARVASSSETANRANAHGGLPVIVLGDFNEGCGGGNPDGMRSSASMTLIHNAGIDCVFSKQAPGSGYIIDATPSDHNAVVAELTL